MSEKPARRKPPWSLLLIPVFLIGLAIAIFAPLATCRWCDGKGKYTYVNRRSGECPGCHGGGKVGYLKMLYNLATSPQF